MSLTTDKKIFIYGDIMLDKYFTGKVSRLSPEAPVPVVKVDNEHMTLGGAANVANNLAKLGNKPFLFGFTGNDKDGEDFSKLAKDEDIEFQSIKSDQHTTTKIRVIGGHQQITRLDFEEPLVVEQKQLELFKKALSKKINKKVGAFILSDYLKGACTHETCQTIIGKCKEAGVPVVVDPKGSDWDRYQGAFMVTPNMSELQQVINLNIPNDDDSVKENAIPLLDEYDLTYLLVTRSEKGMTLISRDGVLNFSTEAQEVYDVSGAGDTVIATVSLGIALGLEVADAVRMANTAAGIVVSKFGTTPIYKDELLKAMNDSYTKILDKKELTRVLDQEKKKGKQVVFTNGCFDILHKGHLSYLRDAKKLGDILVLGLNSDDSVKILKGNDRPINPEQDRAELLSFFDFIDYITIFGEETPYELIKSVRPDVLVKGGDYNADDVVGKEFSGKVQILPFVDGYSTSNIISKLNR